MISIPIVMIDSEGVETIVNLPARFVICPHCRGAGTSSSHLGAFSRDDLDEAGPEFVEDYMRGDYDRPCENCECSGKVKLVDERACITDQQKAALRYMIDAQIEMAEVRAIERAESARGA